MSFTLYAPSTLRSARRWLVASLLITLSACGGKQDTAAPATAPVTQPPVDVEIITVQPNDLRRTLQMPGRVMSVRTAQVRARVEGIVEKRVYQEGSDVKAGDVLFRIDPEVMAANVAVAQAAVAEKQADAQVAEQTLARMRTLLKTNAISTQQYDEAVARQGQAEAAVAAAQAALARAQIDLDHATVRAPIAGRIGRALVTEGALVSKDDATHMATIEQVNPIQVNFAQSSADYLRFRQQIFGQAAIKESNPVQQEIEVDLILEDGSVFPRKGKLLWADFAVDVNTGSVFMRAEFPNPDAALLPGQFVGVRLPFATSESTLSVPQRSVMASSQGQYVYRVGAGNKVESVTIEVGGLSGSDWLIRKGLEAGDRIIVNGLQKVRPGAEVNPVPAPVVAQPAAASDIARAPNYVHAEAQTSTSAPGNAQTAPMPASADANASKDR